MLGKYMIPRAIVQLVASDLEPSEDLQAALENLKRTKSVVDMRKLHANFGQLFCTKLTIGGRLMTSKKMDSDSKKSSVTQKEEFKASVSASVSTPWVSGSVKHEREGGKDVTVQNSSSAQSEHHAFDAIGGNTLLASNPVEWVVSCAKPFNWRVIDRVGLTPMADAIAGLPGYAGVKALFAQAVPALSRYIEMPDSREVKVRLRLAAPTNNLSLSYYETKKDQKDRITTSYYLGHSPKFEATPKQFYIEDPRGAFWGKCSSVGGDDVMFAPRSYRAPAICGYADNKISKSSFGRDYDQEFLNTAWTLTTPFDTALNHGCRVMLQTVPLPENATAPAPSPQGGNPPANPPSTKPAPPSALVVFRNQQGVFLPAMSDDGTGHIFRALKRGAQKPGETIKEGDEIRLCWSFKDQTTGFRDFVDDVFGRRRHAWPLPTEPKPLFMKLPWPRFEDIAEPAQSKSAVPNAMVMSEINSEDPMVTAMSTKPSIRAGGPGALVSYGVQDVAFRIDLVGNEGRGDVDDYMLSGVVESEGEAVKANDGTFMGSDGRKYRHFQLAMGFFLSVDIAVPA